MTPPAPSRLLPLGTLLILAASFSFPLPRTASGQELLDSVDKLLSAQFGAYNQAKNGLLKEALVSEKDALKTAENRFGPTHMAVAPVLTDLASLQRTLALFPEAEKSLKWALAIQERALGSGDRALAPSLGHLAALYRDWGKAEDAEYFAGKALSLLEPDGDPEDRAEAMALLGEIDLDLLRNSDALRLFKRALTLKQGTGSGPALRLRLLGDAAQAFQDLKDQAQAQESLKEALALSQKSFPPDSIEVADALQKLADHYHAAGQAERARPLEEEVLKIDKGFVGVYYGYTLLPYLQRLSKAYLSLGHYQEAKDLLEKTLATCRESFGPKHPLVALMLLRTAEAQEGLGNKKGARTSREEALSILETIFPARYPLVLSLRSQLGR